MITWLKEPQQWSESLGVQAPSVCRAQASAAGLGCTGTPLGRDELSEPAVLEAGMLKCSFWPLRPIALCWNRNSSASAYGELSWCHHRPPGSSSTHDKQGNWIQLDTSLTQ